MIVAGLGFAAAGVIFFFMGSTGATATAPTSGAMATLLAALGAAAGVIFLLFGALHVILAIAIFQLRNIARVITISLFLLIAAGSCLGLVATLVSYSHAGLLWNVSILVVDLLVVWYLLRSSTKLAFHA
jgi:predicted Abi (CAAX) family protease